MNVYRRTAGCMTCSISAFTSVFLRCVHRAVSILRQSLSESNFILSPFVQSIKNICECRFEPHIKFLKIHFTSPQLRGTNYLQISIISEL